MAKDTSAFTQGTLNAPPGTGGAAAPIRSEDTTKFVVANSNGEVNPAAVASDAAVKVMHTSAALVLISIVLLWVLGGLVFRNANL